MKISIAMATYNGAKYLEDQLNSFLLQDLLPDELVVCDDDSTDETIELLQKFSRNAPFSVKIYSNITRLGYAQNFARALSLCTGDYVFLSDQDDVWLNNKISYCIDYFEKNKNTNLLFTNALLVNSNLESLKQTIIDFNKRDNNNPDPNNHGCCVCIRKTFLDIFLPIPSNWAHDTWLNSCAKLVSCKSITSDVLMLYRRHEKAETVNQLGGIVCHYAKKVIGLFNKKDKLRYDYTIFLELYNRFLKQRVFYPKAYDELLLIKNNLEERLVCYNLKGLSRLRYILKLYKKGVYDVFPDPWKRTIEDILVR